MSTPLKYFSAAAMIACFLGLPRMAPAQLDHLPYMLKYNKGQNVQPVFQGWSRNADGTSEMHLGYLNRNYMEELYIPVGPDNSIEPAGPDQGQPTYFYTRNNRQIFSVTVPADFGDQELIWTLTVNGRTEQAVGWLQPEWEIDPNFGGRAQGEEARRNVAPTLALDTPAVGSVSNKLTLTARSTDDGLPTARGSRQLQRNRAVGQEIPPILVPPEGTPEPPKNLPQLNVNARGRQSKPTPPEEGLSVSYIVWRGPAAVTFDPPFSMVEDGSAETAVTFTKPGDYVLQGRAYDGNKSTYEFVNVSVN